MDRSDPGAGWHLEADFGTSRALVRMAERDGRFGIRVRLDADGVEPTIFSLTPDQAGFLGEALPAALAMVRSRQEQQDWELSIHDPFAGLDSDEAGASRPSNAVPDIEDVPTPKRRGQSWSAAEEVRLVEAFQSGRGVDHLATLLQRSPRAIRKRLEKLELVATDR